MAELSAPSAAARLRALADQLEKSGAGKLASDAELASMLGFSGMATSPTPAPAQVKVAQKTAPAGARDAGAGHASGASDVSKLSRGAQLQIRQLRWLLKTRLAQVRCLAIPRRGLASACKIHCVLVVQNACSVSSASNFRRKSLNHPFTFVYSDFATARHLRSRRQRFNALCRSTAFLRLCSRLAVHVVRRL